MIEILVKIIIVAVAVIVFAVSFREEWRRLRNAEREYDAFEQHRAEIGTALIGYDYLLKRLEVATI